MTDLRTVPISLTEAETRAGLWAIRRVLEMARSAEPAELDDLLITAGELPESMLLPSGYPDQFRNTLADLVYRHREFAPVLAEFDRLTGRGTRRRAFDLDDDDPWRDCGAAD